MRDIFTALLLTAALVVLFSSMDCPAVDLVAGGSGYQRPGESEIILPGKGAEPVNRAAPAPPQQTTSAAQPEQQGEETATPAEERPLAEKTKEENMDIIIAFWHGVATVLLGEAAALLVAAAVLRIKGAKDGKQ
jgi:hypothetical protein